MSCTTTRLRVRLFGCMAATDTTGRSYLPRNQKSRAVLAVLALASPRLVSRRQLTALLWSQRGHKQAIASVRQSVRELHQALGDWNHLFLSERRYLSLGGAGLEIDTLPTAQTDLLLEDMNGLDPAFDRWLDDARARFQPIGRTIGEGVRVQAHPTRPLRMFGWLAVASSISNAPRG